MSEFISIRSAYFSVDGIDLLSDINLTIFVGEFWAVVGEAGAGKSLLAHVIAGNRKFSRGSFSSEAIAGTIVAEFPQVLRIPSGGQYYYQQRYNSLDADQGPTVGEYLGIPGGAYGDSVVAQLQIGPILPRKVLQLSSGETKKILLARALRKNPGLLILDNPLAGLDAGSRSSLLEYIDDMQRRGMRMIFIGEPDELPETVTHILVLEKGRIFFSGPKSSFLPAGIPRTTESTLQNTLPSPAVIPASMNDFNDAVRMEGISVRYDGNIIFEGIDFRVKRAERWALKGKNGSGKSTLLSLITGDNPQAYANEIWLFDRKRGTGESIWDIKKKIGFISPELQLYSILRGTCLEVALSGMTDSLGTRVEADESRMSLAESYFKALKIEHLMMHPCTTVSTGEQRLVLLARSLIKDPPLLIFDEPCQGLSAATTDQFNELVDDIVIREQKTLIYVSHYENHMPKCIGFEKRLEKIR